MKELTSRFRPTRPDEPFLLAADIDGTLLGDDLGTEWFKAFSLCYANNFYLALVTGRSLPTILPLITQGNLPQPNFICYDVGTELLVCNDPENVLGQRYAAQISPEWDLEQIYARGIGEGIWKQDFPEGQPRFQAGFYWDGQAQTLEAFLDRMNPQEGYSILPSYQKYIDVIPKFFGKGKVIQFLQKELALDPDRVIVAGDAGNDQQMFETSYKGILPANALEELKALACAPWHYYSPFPAARGVLDGLKHFGFVEEAEG